METSDRQPGSWEKSPRERLAQSQERQRKRKELSAREESSPVAPRSSRAVRPPHDTPAVRTDSASASAPARPRSSSRAPEPHRFERATHRSHTPSSARPHQTRTRETGSEAHADVMRIGGVEISVRVLFILIMIALLASLVAPSVIQWIRQGQERDQVLQELEAARQRQSDLEQKLELWNNPDYIAAQARERLGFVKPGETQYSVLDPGPDYQDVAQVAAAGSKGPERPWVQNFVALTALADSTEKIPATQNVLRTPAPGEEPQSGAGDNPQSSSSPVPESGSTDSPVEEDSQAQPSESE